MYVIYILVMLLFWFTVVLTYMIQYESVENSLTKDNLF